MVTGAVMAAAVENRRDPARAGTDEARRSGQSCTIVVQV